MSDFDIWALILAVLKIIKDNLKPILEFINARPKILEKPKKMLQLLSSPENEKIYREHFETLYSTTTLIGINKPIPINEIYTQLYILPETLADRRYNPKLNAASSEDTSKESQQLKKVDGIEFIKNPKNTRLVILGNSGAGKTTFLKKIAYNTAIGQFKGKLVSFVSLKQWSEEKDSPTLFTYLVKQFEICKFENAEWTIKKNLSDGNFIVLLDGLDEVFGEGEILNETNKKISEFCNQYLKSQVIITCRTNELPIGFPSFIKGEIAKLEEEEIKEFVSMWVALQSDKNKLRKFTKSFLKDLNLSQNEKIKELAGLPIFLTLLCIIYKDNGRFPDNKMEVYEEAVNILLDEKEMDNMKEYKPSRYRIHPNFDLPNKVLFFSKLAHHFSVRNILYLDKTSFIIKTKEILNELLELKSNENINAEKAIRSLETQHNIIIELFRDKYDFSHRSFREYFTAKYFIEEKRFSELLTKKQLSEGWRGTILNTASIIKEELVESFLNEFFNGIRQFILDCTELKKILILANQKTFESFSDKRPVAIRLFYLHLILIELDSHGILDIFNVPVINIDLDDRSIPLGYYPTLNVRSRKYKKKTINDSDFKVFDCELDKARTIIVSYAKNVRRYDIIRLLDFVSKLNLDSSSSRNAFRANCPITFDYHLLILKQCFRSYFDRGALIRDLNTANKIESFLLDLIQTGMQFGDEYTSKYLKKLVGIIFDLTLSKFEETVEIFDKMLFHRKLKVHFKLSDKQLKEINDYLQANLLLLECINLTTLFNRESIKDMLFLPVN